LYKDQIAESRLKEEKLEKLLQGNNRENARLLEKCNQLEKINIAFEKETKNWQQMKYSLQVREFWVSRTRKKNLKEINISNVRYIVY